MTTEKDKMSVAEKLLKGVKEFATALQNDEVISETMTCRTVVLDLEPIPYDPKAESC